ncbi:MAG TPA: HAD-IB family phosphatase [Labilithrix sp.]
MNTQTVAEIVARIEAQEGEGAIVFDGDGTLWSGDIGEDFFDAMIADGRLTEIAREALAREADEQKLSNEGTAMDVARRIHAAYHAGTFPEERVCEIMTWACAGWTRAELDSFAARTLESLGLRGRLHDEALRVAAWAGERGIPVFLVSASPRAIVEQAARIVGIEVARVASATEAYDGEFVSCAVLRPIPYGPGKVTRLREKLGERTLFAAFGDNAFDVPMLRESRVPVAIRPKPRLVERAHEVPGLVTLTP